MAQKGYFDEQKKKALPYNPAVVGVVTSDSGAALQDIISVISRKNPSVRILLAPAVVQGPQASSSISEAISALNRDGRCDVIIVGRGGGSSEDLWAFNEEATVSAVYRSRIPVISAVGHETDITLCDLAADLRAATPTAAADIAVTDRMRQLEALVERHATLKTIMLHRMQVQEQRLTELKAMPALKKPTFFINKNRQRLNNLIESLYNLSESEIMKRSEAVSHRAALLETLSPLRVLARGYCIASKGNQPIIDAGILSKGDIVALRMHCGSAKAVVCEIAKGEEK